MVAFANPEAAGLIPQFLSEMDPRPAREQLNENYAHGGGWQPFPGFELVVRRKPEGRIDEYAGYTLQYPSDPPMRMLSQGQLRNEIIMLFEGAWVVIMQPNGTWEVSRMD